MNIKLKEINENDEKQINQMYEEYMNDKPIPGIERFEGIRAFEDYGEMNFEEWLKMLEREKIKEQLPEEYSTHNLYFAVDEKEKIVGAIDLRWLDVPILMSFGGLIGYSVRPSERGKGYASKMLKLGLEKFKTTNREKVLITCKDFNMASKKVIEKNGGIYQNSYYNEKEGYTYLRYWINIK